MRQYQSFARGAADTMSLTVVLDEVLEFSAKEPTAVQQVSILLISTGQIRSHSDHNDNDGNEGGGAYTLAKLMMHGFSPLLSLSGTRQASTHRAYNAYSRRS